MLHDLLFTAELLIRILLSAVLGGAIGLERVWHGRPAGLRTNMLIAISSCMFTVLSLYAFPGGAAEDSTRIASQIVVGVGFLGAGTMMHSNKHVLGLTTASTIWLVAAIGMAAGAGQYLLAITVTVLAVACLTFFAPISTWIERHAESHARRRGIPVVHDQHDVHYVSYHRHRHGKKRRNKGGRRLDESVGKD